MNLYLLQQYQFINTLYRNNSYTDILCNIDSFFDLLGVYAYPNWLEAEVVDMKFYKYFTEIMLRQPRDKKPSEAASELLKKYNCQIEYNKADDFKAKQINSPEDVEWSSKLERYIPKLDKEEIWVVSVLIPNKYILNDEIFNVGEIQKKLDLEQDTDAELKQDITAELNNQEG